MATSFLIEQSTKSGPLVPALFTQTLASLTRPRATVRGQELRIALDLSFDDAACAGFVLDFLAQGERASGSAHGPSAAALGFALELIADALGCKLVVEGDPIDTEDAIAYLETYEADVLEARESREDLDGDAFVAWLAREEHIALATSSDFSLLPLDDADAVYETLLNSEAVDELFVSERELARLLTRFRARAVTA